jgi:hypothetical protein
MESFSVKFQTVFPVHARHRQEDAAIIAKLSVCITNIRNQHKPDRFSSPRYRNFRSPFTLPRFKIDPKIFGDDQAWLVSATCHWLSLYKHDAPPAPPSPLPLYKSSAKTLLPQSFSSRSNTSYDSDRPKMTAISPI